MTTTTDIRDVAGDLEIVERPEQHRYELRLDGAVRGLVVYSDHERVRAIVHTEIDQRVQGHGLAGRLVHRALVDIEREGRRVQPACDYAAWYIDHHPEFSSLVA